MPAIAAGKHQHFLGEFECERNTSGFIIDGHFFKRDALNKSPVAGILNYD